MPKPSRYVLIWLDEREHYELHLHGQLQQRFQRGDEDAFSRWLEAHTAFAFWGPAGRLSVLKEARLGGTGYWYAYRTQDRHTRKRYLGPSAKVTFARLEQEAKALSGSPSDRQEATGQEGKRLASSPQIEHRSPLLSLRLSPPRLPGSLVERSRLLDELDAVFSHPLTLVSASAGSGKTTLLSAWVAASPQVFEGKGIKLHAERRRGEPAYAWLSLDEPDNDPIRFWLSVIAAVRTCLPTCGEAARELLRSPETPPLSTILTTLLDELVQVDRDIFLILDDYHVISDQAIHDSLLALLDHPPANVHLVLSTRTNPALPLARFRVRSQLLEIRDQDLRFTRQEAASFLVEGMGLPLSEEEVATLAAHTEGWIAGLQLAALALREHEDLSAAVSDFGGSHRYLLDYVQQDILARLPVVLQDFLLQTSILTRLHAALCQAVTANLSREECQQMLEELERANLFVVLLDEQRTWYRFHDLFREALYARLQASQPERVPLLHQRAARWYETQREWSEAITHALAAPDYPYTADLIEQAAPHFWLSGEARTIQDWLLSLPDPVLCAHTRLALENALRLIDSLPVVSGILDARLVPQAQRTITRLEGLVHRTPSPVLSSAEEVLIERRVSLLRALIEARAAFQHRDKARLQHLAREGEARPADAEVSWNMIPLNITYWLNHSSQSPLIPRLQMARQHLMQAGHYVAMIRVMTLVGEALIQAGRLQEAHRQCQQGLVLVEQFGVHTITTGFLSVNLFHIFYAQNRLEEATEALRRFQRIAQDWQEETLLALGEVSTVRLGLACGDLEVARQALHRMEALAEQREHAYTLRWVPIIRVACWLAEAKLEEASAWAAQTMLSPQGWNPLDQEEYDEVLMLVRVALAQHKPAQAVEILARFRAHLDRPENIQTTIAFLALSVVALHQSGQREEALRCAARLLALTEPEGYIRVYLDAGPFMKQALKMHLEALLDDDPSAAAVASSRAYVSRLLAAFEQEEQRRASGRDASPASLHDNPLQQAPIEPLSLQEQRVLRLLVTGQTYAEMATTLIVSPNTIKTQVSSIYRKLGVSRRAEAIARTSQWHLLSSEQHNVSVWSPGELHGRPIPQE